MNRYSDILTLIFINITFQKETILNCSILCIFFIRFFNLNDIPVYVTYNHKKKQFLYTPWWRLGGEEVKLLLILDLGTRWGEWSASRPSRALAQGKGPLVPTIQEAGWASEQVWPQRLEEKSFTLPGIEPRSPGGPARSQTQYWLSYPAHHHGYCHTIFQDMEIKFKSVQFYSN
jgi:hypothetical protein